MGDRCFCIFEGGGAKGIAHVGALKALEESELELCGFAGTSAGAVIAALAAVGYRSPDLISSTGTILDRVDLDRSNVWSGPPRQPASRPGRLFGWFGWTGIVLARNGGGYALLGAGGLLLLAAPMLAAFGVVTPAGSVAVAVGCLLVILLVARMLSSGLASLTEFERGLNQLLRLRIAGRLDPATAHRARAHEAVSFADLERAGCPPLRIIAADISARELKLFSAAATPDCGVAAAVAASVCLPVIFKPWRIGTRLHLDGGLVSNLPAWAFDAERALDRDAWTAVVQVGEPERERFVSGFGILRAAVFTGIFGSGLLNVRNVERLRSVRLKVKLTTLQFDPGLQAACKVVDEASKDCKDKLVYQLCKVPALMTDICERVQIRARRTLNRALSLQGRPDFAGRLRVSIFVRPRDDPASLSADYQIGFEESPDERIRLPVRGSIVGQALEDGEPLFLDDNSSDWSTYLSRPHDRWLRKALSREMAWVFSVPYLSSDKGVEVVVALDSNIAIDLDPDVVDVAMGSIAERVVPMLGEYLSSEVFNYVSTSG